MADSDDGDDTVRAWLVDRTYDDRGMIILVYATPDGERARRKELSATVMNQRGITPTAARDFDAEDLDAVTDEETRDRYAAEATRMREDHDPDDEV